VLHGGSGIPRAQRRQVALETRVMKINIGTELRQAFGGALRATLERDPAVFDRNRILGSLIEPVSKATEAALGQLWA
jgi:fructose-bisphosphate aldolase class II